MDGPFLIAGLGNPGDEYVRTRHNAGFMVVSCLAERWRAGWSLEAKFNARLARAVRAGRTCVLCQPLTYMNASGEAVAAIASYYRVARPGLLVIVDDADLAVGTLRLRGEGSSGGHHGLESVESHLGGRDYARLRLGIGRRAEDGRQIIGHVLGRFSRDEWALFEKVVAQAADAVEAWLDEGIVKAMCKFNRAVTAPEPKDS